MRSTRVIAAAIASLSLVMAACGSDEAATTTTAPVETTPVETTPVETTPVETTPVETTPVGTDYMWTPNADVLAGAEGQVNIVAWPGYIEDGSTDPAYNWVAPFEDITSCKVNVKVGGTSDEMVQLMQSGEYDGVSASGDATQRLMAGGEVAEINLAEFTSYADIFDGLKDKPWNSLGGKPYGIPHGRGANVLVYNTEAFPDGLDSWSPMWEAGSAAEHAISVYDSPIYIADAALWLMATQPDLGITNPYALDQTQFDAAMALLEQQKAIVGQYWSDYVAQMGSMVDGTLLAGTTWEVVASFAQGEGAKVATVKPVEGATGWSDTWMLSSKAANPNCMKLWMDWISSPWANAAATEYFGEAPSNAKGCGLTANPDHCALFHAEDEAYWADVWYWTTATEECLDGRTDVACVPYTEWVNAWNALRA